MNITKKNASIALIFVICLAGLIAWWFSDLYFAREIAPYQTTPNWTAWKARVPPSEIKDRLTIDDPDIPLEVRPVILLRTDATGTKLLLKHRYGTVVYLYDSSNKTISQISEDDWGKATGEIANCWSQLGGDFNRKVTFNTYPDYAAKVNDRKISTYGKYLLFATESHARSKVVLLSAAGPRRGPSPISFPFFGSVAVVKGQKYVQIMDIDSGEFTKEPVRFNGIGENEDYRICWSGDEKYVVVYKPYENFSIVETGKTAK